MTKERMCEPAENTKKVARLLSKRIPHLEFAFWDLSDFMPTFHNVRRNMIFIECESLAHKEVISAMAREPKLMNYLVYSGERKPVAINEEWASARSIEEIRDVIVVIARRDFNETDVFEKNARIPRIERRLVDLMAYSLKGYLPLALDEAVDAFARYVVDNAIKITKIQRYATRRYVGWFLDIVLYRLAEAGKIHGIDPRYFESGRRYYAAVLELGRV